MDKNQGTGTKMTAKITAAAFVRTHGNAPINHVAKYETAAWKFCRSLELTATKEERYGDTNVFFGTWDELVNHLDDNFVDGKLVAILP